MAALVAGVVVLLVSGWLSEWYGLPQRLLLVVGAVNVLYSSYSIPLAARAHRPLNLIRFLVAANLFWATVCLVLVIISADTATLFGFGHLVGEALFVGGLACFEWRWRALLVTA